MERSPTSGRVFSDKCRKAYKKVQEWRDVHDAFDLESDRMYLHDLIEGVQDEVRKLGCQTESINDPTIDQALNVIAEIIDWCKSRACAPEVLAVAEAAIRVNVAQKTIYAACDSGSLKHHRIGEGRGTIRIKPVDLDRWLAQNQVQTSGPKDYLSD